MENAKKEFLASILDESKGERYGGLLLGKDGEPDRHIIKLPGDNDAASWEKQMEWARSIGGDLPTRRMQSLLMANLKEELQPAWYWSCEQRDAGSAWSQLFYNGYQNWSLTYLKCRAVAVRSVPI